jgi:hypothetical protein
MQSLQQIRLVGGEYAGSDLLIKGSAVDRVDLMITDWVDLEVLPVLLAMSSQGI